MKRQFISLLLIGLSGLFVAAPVPATDNSGAVARWDFDVYLNDKRVGKHFYEVSDIDGIRRVQSEANFKYKILFIPAYRYEHSNTEQWSDSCLLGFEAKTNANGKLIDVSGEKAGDNFIVDNGEVAVDLPECVMSFAYWDPRFLDQTRLLNPQTGEYVEVSVEQVAEEVLEVRGQPVAAKRFRLTAYEVDLTLWYSADDQWLALESVAKGGHVIRYELS
ncbi:MAG: DUF6134 family protein [Gammaproteobacteria bacterium]|nr:DUF6134 family protein [Gammaproteobacteria bacterium]MDH3430825.1 DUF6134 family protein [Gammaproteobacteria bacterium]MDH3434463.1 DUF6134 family protein [Gammaproteobacteria bacterium]